MATLSRLYTMLHTRMARMLTDLIWIFEVVLSQVELGEESNWHSFENCLIPFENLRFDWFERAKNVRKIWWKLIWIRFVQFDSNYVLGWVKFSETGLIRTWFDSIRKVNSKYFRFDSTSDKTPFLGNVNLVCHFCGVVSRV